MIYCFAVGYAIAIAAFIAEKLKPMPKREKQGCRSKGIECEAKYAKEPTPPPQSGV